MRKEPNTQEVPPHRSKKDRKKWCRGKVGVEHEPEIRLNKISAWRRARGEKRYVGLRVRCGWTMFLWRLRLRKDDAAADVTRWSCDHERACKNCGKILDAVLTRKDCPDFRPLKWEVEDLPCVHCGKPFKEHEEGRAFYCEPGSKTRFWFVEPEAR